MAEYASNGFINAKGEERHNGGLPVKRIRILMMLVAVALIAVSEPIRAIDLGSASSCVATNDAEIYCMMLGGCPLNGYCHFPDGRNYALWYLYNLTSRIE